MIKGASKGEGLGNEFLSNIHSTDVIAHVVRFFKDKEILHVKDKFTPLEDYQDINLELILADINYLPFKKKSFDSIVSSLVLCSVGNINTTFKELDMVLKPKGKYFFWEHTVFSNKTIIALKSFFIYICNSLPMDVIIILIIFQI